MLIKCFWLMLRKCQFVLFNEYIFLKLEILSSNKLKIKINDSSRKMTLMEKTFKSVHFYFD